MKHILFFPIVALALFIVNCQNRTDKDHPAENNANGQTAVDKYIDNRFETERDEYRGRMHTRLEEMAHEIETARAERKDEKNAERMRERDLDIERRERDRTTLKERINNMGTKTEAEWEEFKREVDAFFDGDRKNNRNTDDTNDR